MTTYCLYCTEGENYLYFFNLCSIQSKTIEVSSPKINNALFINLLYINIQYIYIYIYLFKYFFKILNVYIYI